MEVALYHPEGGYYARRASTDRGEDYYTSPAAHPAFGALIAVALWRMWEALGRPAPFHAVEMGAGGGLLARDAAAYAQALPAAFREALDYVALERSPARSAPDNRRAPYQRLVAGGTPVKGVVGCLLSNELVDSFPVHRFQVHHGAVKEVFLALQDGRLVEELDEPSTPQIARRLEGLGVALPEGYRGEVNLLIGPWTREVAGALKRGFVLTIDYGYEASDLYPPERSGGSLRTYYRHTSGSGPYQRIGMQDITAHVDFSSIVGEGVAAGLRPVGLSTQALFLRSLGLGRWLRELRTEQLSQRERDANMMGMRDLVSPEGLGRFRVLVQEKGVGTSALDRLLSSESSPDEAGPPAEHLPVPLLRAEHMPLMEGRYPHAGWRWEGP